MVFAVAAAYAPSALAHSVLIGTQPGNDQVVPASPDEVLLEFNEPVDASLGSLRVFDGQGRQVDSGEVTQPAATEVAVGIDSTLAPGTYTVAWRVVSADSDPISGAFVFHVLERGVGAANVSIDALTGTSEAVDILFTAGRFFDLALLLLVVGGSAVLVVALPTAPWRVRRRLYGVLAALAAALAVVALVNILLQGATAGGLSLADAFSWSLFRSVLETDYGEVLLIASALAATLALTALALRYAEGRDRRPLAALTLALGAGLALTPSFSGHARTLGGLGLVSDIFHVIAAAVWTGGLAFLLIALLTAEADRWPLATRAVPRFSNMAVGSVVALLVAGIISAYLELRTWQRALGQPVRPPGADEDHPRRPAARARGVQQPLRRPAPEGGDRVRARAATLPAHRRGRAPDHGRDRRGHRRAREFGARADAGHGDGGRRAHSDARDGDAGRSTSRSRAPSSSATWRPWSWSTRRHPGRTRSRSCSWTRRQPRGSPR